jgi:hypothetical protein
MLVSERALSILQFGSSPNTNPFGGASQGSGKYNKNI